MFKIYTAAIFMLICVFLIPDHVCAKEELEYTKTLSKVRGSLWDEGVYTNLSDDQEIDSIIEDLESQKIQKIIPEELYLTINRI
jgi:hypothetical protein